MSTFKVDTLQSTSGGATTLTKQSAAKTWCRFDTDSSTSITGSFNVSSLTDAATGRTSINLTNAFDAVTYAVLLGNDDGEQVAFHRTGDGNTASQVGAANYNQDGNAYADSDIMSAAMHGDLA